MLRAQFPPSPPDTYCTYKIGKALQSAKNTIDNPILLGGSLFSSIYEYTPLISAEPSEEDVLLSDLS
jgi:hypothetical protein